MISAPRVIFVIRSIRLLRPGSKMEVQIIGFYSLISYKWSFYLVQAPPDEGRRDVCSAAFLGWLNDWHITGLYQWFPYAAILLFQHVARTDDGLPC